MKMTGRRKMVAGRKHATADGKAGPVMMPAALKAVGAALSSETGVSVEEGWGASNFVFKLRGKMFVLLIQDELVVKLPKARVDELVAASAGRRFDPRRNGRLMKEWLVLPQGGANWLELARESYRFVFSGTAR